MKDFASASSSPSPLESGSSGHEEDCVTRCRNGDVDAFDDLVAIHQDRIFNLCYWMLGNRDEAADACQDAFLRAFRALPTFRGESAFKTWLHRIAVNTSIDALARRKRAPIAYSDMEKSERSQRAGDDDIAAERGEDASAQAEGQRTSDPALAVERYERRRAVRRALSQIPEHYRSVLVLFDIEGQSYDEIAQVLQLPLGTVKSRINRARLALRDELQNVRELFED